MKTPLHSDGCGSGRVPSRAWRRWGLVAALIACVAALAVSCATTTRTIVAPPSIPGATFVGSDSCAQCHAEISRDFPTSTHARMVTRGENSEQLGCESCHGPGSKHNESGGAARTIVNPSRSPETCFQCHLDMRGRFSLPHHHPVEAGKVSCADCHEVHKGHAVKGGGTQAQSENATCIRCHPAQRGPHVYEHEALREGCITCHNPHGSVNPRMLTERSANLCLKCHFQQQAAGGQVIIGGSEHAGRLARGTCWSAGCHEAVHGSQVNSSLRF